MHGGSKGIARLPELILARWPDKSPEERELLKLMQLAGYQGLIWALMENGAQRVQAVREINRMVGIHSGAP